MSQRRATSPRRALAMAAVLAATASGLAALPQAASAAAESDLTLTPNPAYASGPFKGWGSSLVWMANATGSYPEELRDELIDKVFGDDGLNLNIARYNIGGGNASDVPAYLRPGGAVPGWWNAEAPLADENGDITSDFADRDRFRAAWTGENASDYDFSADAAQLAWVSAIKDQVDTWEAFSNSPPYFLTESGFVSGGTDPNTDQIRADSLQKFATYLKTVTQHIEDTQGISFDTIDPLNEPNTNYWKTTIGEDGWPTPAGRQEGAHAGPALQAALINALADELAEADTTTDATISGPDETNPDLFVQDWNGWDAEARTNVTQLNVHTYGTNNRPLARDVAKSADKPLWMSEVEGNWGGNGWNPESIENGLGIAQLVNADLRELESEAWVLWQPVEDLYNMEKVEKLNWGSIFIDFDCNADGQSARRIADGDADPTCHIRTNSKFDTLRNFTHYIRPGDQLVSVGDSATTAAISGSGTGATLVHTNDSSEQRQVEIDLSLFGDVDAGATVTPIVTTESPSSEPGSNALQEGSAVAVDPLTKTATLTVPAKSVTTFVVSGVSGVSNAAPALRDGKTFTITGVQSGHALTATGSGAALGAPGGNSAWTVTLIDDQPGTFRDRFVLRGSSGAALATNGGSTTLKTVTDAEAASDSTVLWMMTTTDGTSFSLLNGAQPAVLDVGGQNTAVGSSVGVWQSNSGANQLWTLAEVTDGGTDPGGTTRASFLPGQDWRDDNGDLIQAHGGQVVPAKDADGETIYYLYGEDHTYGYHSSPGVHVYSSRDLYNWKDEGVALRSLGSKDDFEDPYFEALYGDYTQKQKDAVYRDLGTTPVVGATPPIIERPKVIYNEKTGKWVMWAHMDGPSATSTAQYAKANAGVAIADSPVGPFRYIDSYRLNYAPADAVPVNNAPNNPGMARDMNLFVDDDGTGYIIYSSEENATMFISKLDEEFTDLATPAVEAKLGVDYNRIFVNESRESPAIFQHDDRYFMLTSGTTGWNPNPTRWATSTDLMGTWTEMGDPFPWWAQSNSWNSQPTSVIPYDPEEGKYIYMGDRWNGGDDALTTAPMVWLPIDLGTDGDTVAVEVWDEWTLDDIENGSPADSTGVPASLPVGGTFDVPRVSIARNGIVEQERVEWTLDGSFTAPGVVTAKGTLPEFDDLSITRSVAVLPENVRYLVDAGGSETATWRELIASIPGNGLLNSHPDQELAKDSGTGESWGYISEGSKVNGTDGLFSTLRYAVEKRDLTYRFDGLPEGSYTVHVGYADPWDQWDDRGAHVSINGAVVEADHDYTASNESRSYAGIQVEAAGRIDLELSPTRKPDVLVSWVMITADETTEPEKAELSLSADAATAGERISVDAAGLEAGEKVSFALHSDPIDMGTVTADAAGDASLSWRIPTEVVAGRHEVVMTRADGSEVRAALTVRAAQAGTEPSTGGATTGGSGGRGGDLAATGPDSATAVSALILAGLLLAAGALFSGRSRRRTRS